VPLILVGVPVWLAWIFAIVFLAPLDMDYFLLLFIVHYVGAGIAIVGIFLASEMYTEVRHAKCYEKTAAMYERYQQEPA
jgi:hypothetical protein